MVKLRDGGEPKMSMLLFYFTCAVVTFGVNWYYVIYFEEFCNEAFSSFRLHSKEESDEMGTYYENSIKVYQPIVRMACIQSAALSSVCFLLLEAHLRNNYFMALMVIGMCLLLYVISEGWYIWFYIIAKEKLYFETDTLEEAERWFMQLKASIYHRNMRNKKKLKLILKLGVGIDALILISVILYFFSIS